MIGLVRRCKTPNCGRVSRARGWCWRCYHRFWRKRKVRTNMTPKLTITFTPDGGFTWHMDAGARAADIIAALETVKASLVKQLLASAEAARVVATTIDPPNGN